MARAPSATRLLRGLPSVTDLLLNDAEKTSFFCHRQIIFISLKKQRRWLCAAKIISVYRAHTNTFRRNSWPTPLTRASPFVIAQNAEPVKTRLQIFARLADRNWPMPPTAPVSGATQKSERIVRRDLTT